MECSAALPALKARPKATIPLLLGAIPLRKNYAAQLSPVDSNSCRTLLASRLLVQLGRPHPPEVRDVPMMLTSIDSARSHPILLRKRGSHWLRVRREIAGDPLNLMRVMPP